jgi:hypothetical protein
MDAVVGRGGAAATRGVRRGVNQGLRHRRRSVSSGCALPAAESRAKALVHRTQKSCSHALRVGADVVGGSNERNLAVCSCAAAAVHAELKHVR